MTCDGAADCISRQELKQRLAGLEGRVLELEQTVLRVLERLGEYERTGVLRAHECMPCCAVCRTGCYSQGGPDMCPVHAA